MNNAEAGQRPAESTSQPNRGWVIWGALGPLVGVVLGGLLTYAGVERQIQADGVAQRRQLSADKYLALLDAADDYQLTTERLLAEGGEVVRDGTELNALPVGNAWLTARHEFQGALNEVYVYGSSDGWDAAGNLAATLPNSVANDFEFEQPSPDYSSRYIALLAVLCREAVAEPRADCR